MKIEYTVTTTSCPMCNKVLKTQTSLVYYLLTLLFLPLAILYFIYFWMKFYLEDKIGAVPSVGNPFRECPRCGATVRINDKSLYEELSFEDRYIYDHRVFFYLCYITAPLVIVGGLLGLCLFSDNDVDVMVGGISVITAVASLLSFLLLRIKCKRIVEEAKVAKSYMAARSEMPAANPADCSKKSAQERGGDNESNYREPSTFYQSKPPSSGVQRLCQRCGAAADKSSLFCCRCGAKLETATAADRSAAPSAVSDPFASHQYETPTEKVYKPKRKNIPAITSEIVKRTQAVTEGITFSFPTHSDIANEFLVFCLFADSLNIFQSNRKIFDEFHKSYRLSLYMCFPYWPEDLIGARMESYTDALKEGGPTGVFSVFLEALKIEIQRTTTDTIYTEVMDVIEKISEATKDLIATVQAIK